MPRVNTPKQGTSTIQLHVNEMANIISTYIEKSQAVKMEAKYFSPFMLWGPPGVGKSQSLNSIKKNVEKATGKKVVITDVRLLLFNPVDLRGIPVPDAAKEFAIWLKPQIFNMDPAEDIINILMMDEISAAPPSVQAASYQITLDRKVGEHKLPDNCYIICAGNRVQDKSVAYKMPKALANRLVHFDIATDLDDWKLWAMNNGIDQSIIGFLNFAPSKLYMFDPTSDDNAFPTTRSWERASSFLKLFGSLDAAFDCIAGSIGLGVAGEFKRYCKVYTKIPDVDKILKGEKVEYVDEPDINYALSSALCAKAANASIKEIENIINYIDGMREEYSVLTMKDMMLLEGFKTKILKLPAALKWTRNHKNLIK